MPALNWFPTWQILVAFNNSLYDDLTAINTVASPGVLGGYNVWTDITLYCMDIHTHRGRQHLIDRFVTGTADLTLWNQDGRFDSWNTSSPYAGLIDTGKPVRIQATIGGTTYPVFTGYTDVWATNWADEVRSTVSLSCVDAFQSFTNAYVISSLYPQEVLAGSPVGYWKLSEPTGATAALDSSSNNNHGSYSGTYSLGNPGISAALADTAANLMPSGSTPTGGVTLPTAAAVSGDFTFEAWYNVLGSSTAWTSSQTTFWEQGVGSSSGYLARVFVNTDSALYAYIQDGSGNVLDVKSTTTLPTDSSWHHVVVTRTGTTVTMYLDGVALGTSALSSNVTGYSAPTSITLGITQNLPAVTYAFPGELAEVALYPSVLSSTQVQNHYNSVVTGSVESSGARLGRVLNWIGWPTNPRNIDAGSSQMQAINQSLTGTTVLTYLQLVEVSENGALFMDRSGNVRFIARQSLLLAPYTTSQQTFGDGGGSEIPYEPVPQIAKDTIDLYPSALVQRQDGVIQQATNTTAAAKYGPRTYQPNQLLVTTDLEALEYADWEVAHLSTPLIRIRSIIVHPLASDPTSPATAQAVLARELMDRVTVNRHALPGGGTALSIQSMVEGVDHQVDFAKGDWTVTFALDPADTQSYWVWGTSEWDTTPPGTSIPTRWAY